MFEGLFMAKHRRPRERSKPLVSGVRISEVRSVIESFDQEEVVLCTVFA